MQRKLALSIARRVVTAGLVAAVSGWGAGARAEAPHPPIVLVLDPCAAVDALEVRRLVPIEMGAPLVAAAGDPGDTTRVFVGCVVGSPQLVRLEVRDPVNGRHVDRVITLVGDSKTDQARLVAIVAVELVAASRSELRESAPVAVVAPLPEPLVLVAAAPPPPAFEAPRWRALALGSLRHVAGLPGLLPGGGLAVERAVSRRFALGVDLLAEGAAQPTALGDVDAFLASVSVFGAWRFERGRFTWESGLGARGGVARLAGRAARNAPVPVDPSVLTAPWVGPLVEARAAATLGRSFVLSLGGEVGTVTSAVEGHVKGQPDVAVSGTWWSVTLGVGHAL